MRCWRVRTAYSMQTSCVAPQHLGSRTRRIFTGQAQVVPNTYRLVHEDAAFIQLTTSLDEQGAKRQRGGPIVGSILYVLQYGKPLSIVALRLVEPAARLGDLTQQTQRHAFVALQEAVQDGCMMCAP